MGFGIAVWLGFVWVDVLRIMVIVWLLGCLDL